MRDAPNSFISRMISQPKEDSGIEQAALRIKEFFEARSISADSEEAWLQSYFSRSGMESMADTDLIGLIIERELFADSTELTRCSACGRAFIEDQGVITRLRPEPFPVAPSESSQLLSEGEALQQKRAELGGASNGLTPVRWP